MEIKFGGDAIGSYTDGLHFEDLKLRRAGDPSLGWVADGSLADVSF